ncbi:MAG: hypothetical protein R2705_13300 [Ilumatobacteraceae bacterium]
MSNGGVARASVGSVADDETAHRLVSDCVDSYGSIDAVVNNAGIVATGR